MSGRHRLANTLKHSMHKSRSVVAIRPGHLAGLFGTAGKAIAKSPSAFAHVETLRNVKDVDEFRSFLKETDLGVATPAAEAIRDAAGQEISWKEAHATMLRSAEQQLADMYSANS